MGRQVTFYMTRADEKAFLDHLRGDRNVGILPSAMPSRVPRILDELPARDDPFSFLVWLWDMDNSPPPQMCYVPEQGYFVVDMFRSEVIEFTRSRTDQGRLVRGRIWAELVGWDPDSGGKPFRKGKSFQRWFERLARWIRRHSIRDQVGDYLLPGAAEFARKGGELRQFVVAKDVLVKFHGCPTQ